MNLHQKEIKLLTIRGANGGFPVPSVVFATAPNPPPNAEPPSNAHS